MEVNEKIVLSGISGRYPECNNVQEFKEALFNGVDLVTEDDGKYQSEVMNIPKRVGKIPQPEKFDAAFFGVHPKQAKFMDPRHRKLLEAIYECIVDAGYNPQELSGTKTGVYVGITSFNNLESIMEYNTGGYTNIGLSLSLAANRASYCFNFIGPSYAVDSACASSMTAFSNAVKDLKSGEANHAIVCGAHMLFHPFETLEYKRLNMISDDGKCKVFTTVKDGYARSESVTSILLQRESQSRRIYATVLGVATNADGYKEEGITYPSGKMQYELMKELYSKANVDPNDVAYFEAHGTGTPAGDTEECQAIEKMFCDNRTDPLPIGAVKSNMGHSEIVSGLSSVTKVVLAMESLVIPANLYTEPLDMNLPGIRNGKLKVLSKNLPWNGGIVGINSFGFGGTNAHLILQSNSKEKPKFSKRSRPRLVHVSGRTEEAVNYLLNEIEKNQGDDEFLALVDEVHKINVNGHNYRGYIILGDNLTIKREVGKYVNKRPIWFIYTGIGSQWIQMGQDLLKIELFRKSVERCAAALKQHDVDLLDILTNPSPNSFYDITNSFCAIAAVEIALTDILYQLGIVPDSFAGHSFGEVGCSYADGMITPEEAILLAYARGYCVKNIKSPVGQMAAVGLSKEECQEILPEDISIACNNSGKNITITGLKEPVTKFVEKLICQGIFAKNVESGGIAYHSKYVKDAEPLLFNFTKNILRNPKPRSSKWISTSVPDHKKNEYWTQYNCAEYHTNNFCNQVLFTEIYHHIPKDAIVIEVAPHGLLQSILKKELGPNTTNIPLTNKSSNDNEEFFLSSIGKIYIAGGVPNLRKLYNNVTFPVSRGTKMLSPLVKWDHHVNWFTPYWKKRDSFGEIVTVNLSDKSFMYLQGHNIDGNVLMPASGYLDLIWQVFSCMLMKDNKSLPVVIEHVEFKSFTILPPNEDVKFLINIMKQSGYFEIFERDSVVVTGRIRSFNGIKDEYFNLERPVVSGDQDSNLKQEDFYKVCRLRRHMYKNDFQSVKECDVEGCKGKLEWKGNFTTFLDSMIQLTLINITTKKLILPKSIEKLAINPIDINKAAREIELEVYYNQYLNIIKSEGVEMVGLEFSEVPTRKIEEDIQLETYEFVPYMSSDNMNLDDAICIAFQIIFQNCNSFVSRLKIYELTQNDVTLVNYIRKILNTQPITDPMYIQAKEDNQCHVVITTDKLLEQHPLENIEKCLETDGFILYVGDLLRIKEGNLQIIYKAVCDETSVCLLRPNRPFPKNYVVINIRNSQFDWLEKVKDVVKHKNYSSAYLYSQSEDVSGILGFTKCLLAEPNETPFRSILILDKDQKPFSVDEDFYRSQLKKNLSFYVLKNGQWGTFVHRPLRDLGYREVENASVTVLTPGDLSTLTWIERPSKYQSSNSESQLVYTYYSSLNSEDLLVATQEDRPSRAREPTPTSSDKSIGIEYAGITDSGERIMGLVASEGLSLQVQSDQVFSWKVPKSWSLEDAATVPYAYAMSYYALVIRGQMRPAESVLIHLGREVIGLAAISIALYIECTVFTTVRSKEEQQFIKKLYPQLNEENIGNSGSISFMKMVQQNTKGNGVDLVLNSLAAGSFYESLRCTVRRGRFVEIGKSNFFYGIIVNSKIFLNNCSFHGIILEDLFDGRASDTQEIKQLLEEGIKSGTVKPLPRKIFPETEIETAFKYLQSGKNEEKVLIQIRNENADVFQPPVRSISAKSKIYFDPKKSYVVIGGLGGVGLELTDWMIEKGATKIILNSRRDISSGYQRYCFNKWSQFVSVIVKVNLEDTTTLEGAKNLIMTAEELGPVGGIFHVAVALHDTIIDNQTKETFELVFKPKIISAQNMDTITRKNCPELDYFTVFSSSISGRGLPSTTNYGMANSAIEMLCLKRKEENFPGLAIQWGPIDDVGIWTRLRDTFDNLDKIYKHVMPQGIHSCLNALETFMLGSTAIGSSVVLKSKNPSTATVSKETPSEMVAHIMQFENIDLVDKDATLTNLGMDSIMFTEVRHALYTNFQLKFSATEVHNLTFNKLIQMEK